MPEKRNWIQKGVLFLSIRGKKKKREKYLLFSPRKEVGITHWWCFKSDSRGQLVQCWKIGCHLPLQDCGEVESLQKCKIVAKKWNLESEILLKVEGKWLLVFFLKMLGARSEGCFGGDVGIVMQKLCCYCFLNQSTPRTHKSLIHWLVPDFFSFSFFFLLLTQKIFLNYRGVD